MKILIVNVGSTSLKFKLFDMPSERVLASGGVEGIGQPSSRYRFGADGGLSKEGEAHFDGYLPAIQTLMRFLTAEGGVLPDLGALDAVGFKVVMGGGIMGPVELSEDVLAVMEEFSLLAPTHNPPYIAAIRTFREALPRTPLIGLFEPAFHQTMPEYAWRYAVPWDWAEKYGIRRYGYHGASHRYIAGRAADFPGGAPAARRIISCHLGGSSSLCAIRDGQSIDTSMGWTPQSGVLHSTRPHDLDPFIPLYLIKKAGMSVEDVVRVFCRDCGLKALSGVSGEMRDVLAAAEGGHERARLAVESFCYGVKKQIGAYVAALGGVDVLVFTGGIGERSPEIRALVCDGLECMGIVLDREKNAAAVPDCAIEADRSRARILALATNEELIVARVASGWLQREGGES
ncbi:MAG: acetate kinase [Candidatus Sumerlaeia bacterium]